MKRVLAILLSVCLLLPMLSTVTWAAGSNAYQACADVPYSYNGVRMVDANNEIFSYGTAFEQPIDLTAYGYPTGGNIASGKLALQMDVCVSGKAAVVKAMETMTLAGQIEIASGGICDVQERSLGAAAITWKANAWNRVVIDLSRFTGTTGGAFDPTNFNYMRMYVGGLGAYADQYAYVKIANVQIVDLTQPLDEADAPALGDGTPADQVPEQDTTFDAVAYKELVSFPYNGTAITYASGEVYSVAGKANSAIDLTAFGYPKTGLPEPGKIGLQFDYYISGDAEAVELLEKGRLSGQIEISSGGTCDVEELATAPNKLKGKAGEWVRVYLDFAWFTGATGGTFDPTAFDYFRMYFSVQENYPNASLTMKVCNLRVVDFTQPLTEEEAPEIGDGTFVPKKPVYTVESVQDAYVTDTAVVSGYNLQKYAYDNDITNVTDWTPIIQSLLYGLAEQGGGMLYIPAGIYPCYGNIILPTGVTMQGDWTNPDDSVEIQGTILAVYGGENTAIGAFVSMADNSYMRSLAFWYPNQNAAQPKSYPYTISMGSTTHLKDITLVNSYNGVYRSGGSCPDTESIYGTPLNNGMEMDMISDSYGMENIHFAPDYWINSGLPGAPESAADADALREWLYYSATALTIKRMDWSWTTYSSFKGYSVGIHFAHSDGGDYWPNGQCYDITIENCYTALQIDGIGGAGMVMNGFTVKNCEYGVFFANIEKGVRFGQLNLINADISANMDAIVAEYELAKVSLTNSIVRRGAVKIKNGWFTALNTKMYTAAPQIVLEQGTQAAVLAAVTDAWGDRVTVNNKAHCLLAQENKNPITEEMPIISREQGSYQHHRAASSAVTIAQLDNTGKTDVSEELNVLLNQQAVTGGTVFLPPGFYRIDTAITVPTGVELLGSLDFGQAEMYNGVGSILQIYHGKNQPNEATIILEAGAGVRGVQINYPEQNFIEGTQQLVSYAHTIQGRGEGAYVINVSSRNSWSGVDFMTYRCDNHYIDSFRGSALKSYVAVGGGAENGIVRNCHLQYTSWTYGDLGSRGAWPRVVEDPSNEAREAWRMDLYIFSGHNLDNYTIGHVKNQLHFGNMNYCGYTGINVVAEDSGLADVTVWGQNTDCCTISMNVEAAERVDFISLQTTAFTWIAERQEAEMNLIHLGADCDATVNVFGAALYENPDYMFDVENGTLNIYGATYKSSAPMTNLGANGKVNLVDAYIGAYQSGFDGNPAASELTLAATNPENVTLSYSFYCVPLLQTDELGGYTHVYEASSGFRMDVPEDLQVPKDGEIVFSEAFTDYSALDADQQKVATLVMGSGASVAPRRGALQITHARNAIMAGASAKDQLALSSGTYRMEVRVNLESMRETDTSRFTLALYNEKGSSLSVAHFDKNGDFEVQTANGRRKVGEFATGKWYRVGIVLDMDANTYTVYLMDDNYNTLAASGAQALAAETVTGMWVYAEADFGDDGTKTVAQFDYLTVIATAEGYGLAGDVDGSGKVDSTDARLVLQYAVKKINETKLNVGASDVNGDGKVDSTDARLILQYAVKKITAFPAA